MEELEEEAYKLAGRQFRIYSSKDVAQVLYRDLRLPTSAEESADGKKATNRGVRVTSRQTRSSH